MVAEYQLPAPVWTKPYFLIGVTGSIAAGKSAFSAALAQHGALRLDADVLARQSLEAPETLPQLRKLFGASAVGPDGTVDRAFIASSVFADPARRTDLERLIHPLVRARFEAARADLAAGSIVTYDVPLLFEAALQNTVDLVVVVDAEVAVRAARAKQRSGWSQEEFLAREGAQWPIEKKRKEADLVVYNNGTPGELQEIAVKLLERIRAAEPTSESK